MILGNADGGSTLVAGESQSVHAAISPREQRQC